MKLLCELWDDSRKVCWNHWPLWFFPSLDRAALPPGIAATESLFSKAFAGVRSAYHPLSPPSGTRVFVSHRLPDHLIGFVENGGRLLLLSEGVLKEAESCRYRTVPINYGTVGNMGTVIRRHPALGDFPHEGWCDLAFVPLIQGVWPMSLDPFRPQRINPIIRSIGHQATMEDKAYLFEVGVGKGVFLACSLDLRTTHHVHPAAHHLLYCMMKYLARRTCVPEATIAADQLRAARIR